MGSLFVRLKARVLQTLMLVPRLHWILVEDGESESPVLASLLQRTGIPSTHLSVSQDSMRGTGRGMAPRNAGLAWLRRHFAGQSPESVDAVVYFADDDNSYDLRLFETYIRRTKGLAAWPVGFAGGGWVESAELDEQGRVSRWRSFYKPEREFALDMAAFAVHLRLILANPDAGFGGRNCSRSGHFETCFLRGLGGLTKADVDPLGFRPEASRELLVWHTRTVENKVTFKGDRQEYIL